MDNESIIRGCFLFHSASSEILAPLARASRRQKFAKNAQIFAADDEADGLRVILSGQVRIWLADSEGRELTLSYLGKDDTFGEIALLDTLPRTANASALEETECLFLPAVELERAMDRDPALSRHLIHSLCEIMRHNLSTISGFAFEGLDARLAKTLHKLAIDHAEIEGTEARFSRRFSQNDLALLLGVSREAVNKRLKHMQNEGLIDMKGGLFVVPDMGNLAAREESADGP